MVRSWTIGTVFVNFSHCIATGKTKLEQSKL